MVKELMHDPLFLAGKSEVATKEVLQKNIERQKIWDFLILLNGQ